MVTIEEFENICNKYSELNGKRTFLNERLAEFNEKKNILTDRYNDALKAREIIQIVAEQVQKTLEKRLSEIISLALKVVFPDPYVFKLKFVVRRNRTECDVLFVKHGKEIDPMYTTGGGPKDVASFAARLAFWALRKDKRPVIIADEPFKYLHSKEYQRNCSKMLDLVSQELGVQLLIVTDQSDIDGDNVINIFDLLRQNND